MRLHEHLEWLHVGTYQACSLLIAYVILSSCGSRSRSEIADFYHNELLGGVG